MIKHISIAAGLIITFSTLGGLSWAAKDIHDQVASNTSYIAVTEWKRLEAIRKARKLTQEEYIEWCVLGKKIGVFGECPRQ
jgi:hypothetical protein